MLGVMLARPLASLVTFYVSWHAVFALSAACLSVLVVVLARSLPRRVPKAAIGYARLLVSMSYLARGTPVLQRKALYQAAVFSSFTLFWTTAPLLLAGPDYRMSQFGIAWFALVGAAAVITAPIAGRLADRGWTRPATGVSIGVVAACFPLTRLAQPGSTAAFILLAAAGLLIGMGMTANVVLGQRAIFLLRAEHRSRLNGLYIAASYLSGAVGSAAGGWAYARGGWPLASWIGLTLPFAALIAFATEFRTIQSVRKPATDILETRSLP
jgi:predicted MFS family arabinose efflux permease